MIEIFDNRVEITNPGGLPKGLSSDKFGELSVVRNPIIASILQRVRCIEKMGTGISRMRNKMSEVNLPLPEFEFIGFFVMRFFRQSSNELGEKLTKTRNSILHLISANSKVTIVEMANHLGLSTTSIEKNIAVLKDKGLIARLGAAKGGYWLVN